MPPGKLALSFRIFKNGQLIREDRLVQGVIKIGKVPSAHLRIDDESVSRMHAIVEVTSGCVSLIDLGSTRGTFVNGKKINKATLQSGDVITLGETRVELAIADAAASVVEAAAGSLTAAAAAPNEAAAGGVAALVHASAIEVAIARVAAPAPQRTAETAGAASPEIRAVHRSAVPPPVPAALGRAAVPSLAGDPPPREAPPPAGFPLDTVADPRVFQRAVAESADEWTGARAVEVAAMLGDSVIGVKHCMDPRSGKVTPATWGVIAAGAACLLASVVAFTASVRSAADDARRLDRWTRIDHKPARAFRPHPLDPGADWVAFGGLALGLVGATLGLVRVRRERTSPYYRIGIAPGVELAVEHAPLAAFPLVAPSGDDFVFNYGAGIDGELIVDGKTTPFAELAATGRSRPSAQAAGAIEVPIPAKARIHARTGQTSFVISAVARPRRHATPLLANLESRALSYVAGSLAVHLAIWGLLQAIPPEAGSVSIMPGAIEELGIRAAITAQSDPPPDPIENRGPSGGNHSDLPAMALPPGSAGKPEARKADGRMQVARTDDPPQMSREEAIQIAIRAGILGSDRLRAGVRALAATSDIASGFGLENIAGAIYGADGEGRGMFGGGVGGIGIGGGCLDATCGGTIASGSRYGTIGTGPDAGSGFRLPGGPGGNRRGHAPEPPHTGEPRLVGTGYDKSIIRRYVRRHINEIGYCYEKQLLARPSLGGEVMVTFLIAPSGSVQSASGVGFDREVSSCVAGVVKTIEFPATGDGGSVQVNYPFHFRAAGQ